MTVAACRRRDRNRNARLARLGSLVPGSNAIVGIDLADSRQMVVVTRSRFAGVGAAEVPLPRLGSAPGVGLGCRPCRG